MQTEHLEKLAIEALNDLKALDLITIDIRDITTLADTMIICTGRSNQHVKSIAKHVVEKAQQKHHSYIKMEGEKEGEWVIVDLADVIVHVMLSATRTFYNLEDLWEPIELLREHHANSSAGRR